MAVGLDLDTEYANRTGIPSGTAGTLTQGGFSDFFVGVWVYRPSSTVTYALTAGGAIIHGQAGAREIVLGFNSAGAALADLNLQVTYNSGGGVGTPATFSGHTGASFLDEWMYYFFYENAANDQVAGYIRLADLNTAVTLSRANDNAGSQYINTLTFGNTSGNNAVVLGHYAFARARDSAASSSDVLTYANSGATIAGDWGFWALPDNATATDTSGNSRPLTFGGTLTTETSPVFGTAPVIDTHPVSQTVADGATATFTATSAGATSFQWQSNQTGAFANISGATSSSYTTPATTQAYQGRQFRMVATNATGSATSGAASLGVTGFPVYLWDTSVQSGNDVWLRDPTLAGAPNLNGQTNESVALIDSQNANAVFGVARAESVALADTQTAQAVYPVAEVESIALSDAQSVSLTVAGTQAESIALSDLQAATGTYAGAAAESVAITDSQDATITGGGGLTGQTDESVALSDSQVAQADFAASRAESVALADSQAAQAVFNFTQAETVTLTDGQTAGLATAVAVAEAFALSDSQTGEFANNTVAESFALLDSQTAQLVTFNTRAESFFLLDTYLADSPSDVTIAQGNLGFDPSRWEGKQRSRAKLRQLIRQELEAQFILPGESAPEVSADVIEDLVPAAMARYTVADPARIVVETLHRVVEQIVFEQRLAREAYAKKRVVQRRQQEFILSDWD